MVPACSVKVPRVSTYSGSRHVNSPFAYGAFTLSGRLSQNRSARLIESIPRSEPQDARTLVWALPFSLAATHRITCCFLFLRLLCPSPKLFAAYHVLHRLLVPRHPPYALISITKRFALTGMKAPLHMHSVACVGNRPIFFKSVFFRLYC